jgi:hypothetical protein
MVLVAGARSGQGWLTIPDGLGGLVIEAFRPLSRPWGRDRRQAVRTPGTVSARIAARSWMPSAFAVRVVHPLCLSDWARCVLVHLALPLPSRQPDRFPAASFVDEASRSTPPSNR